MKNRWSTIAACTALALTLLAPGLAAAEDMKMKVDYSKTEMMMKDGMELVPLRSVAESLGYMVTWNGENRSVTLTYGKMMDDKQMDGKMMEDKKMDDKMMGDMAYTVKLMIGSKILMVGMKENMVATAPVILNDKTYVTKEMVEMYLASPPMMK